MMTVRDFILLLGLKQVRLACTIGTDASTLSRFLCGWQRLPRKYVRPLAAALDVTELEIETNQILRARVARAVAG